MTDEAFLRDRIVTLQRELQARPTRAQLEWVQEYAGRRERLYEAVLARNVVLRRKLDEAKTG